MTSRALQLAASIALGALTTLAIAWAFAAWMNPNHAKRAFSATPGPNNLWYAVSIQDCPGHTRINRSTVFNLKRDPNTGAIQTIGSHSGDGIAISEDLAGWPCRAMRCENDAEITIGDGVAVMQTTSSGFPHRVGVIELSPWTRGSGMTTWRALPDRPMWPGFAIDTLLFAAAWWLILFGSLRCRRARRIQRGLCPKCAYDLRGKPFDQQICPECGWSPKPGQV